MLCLCASIAAAQDAPQKEQKPKADYVLPSMPARAKFFVKEGDFDADGAPEVLVETKILRLVFDPKAGGRVGSWVYKPTNHDFTNRPAIRVDGGMLGDHVWQQGYFGDWCEAEYTWKVEQLDDRVLVHLRCPGKTGALAYIIFNKTITILPDSAAVRVDYDIQNDFRSTVPLTYGIWFHNCAVGRKESGPRYFFFPTEIGIQKLDVERASAQVWLEGPGRGWAGALATKADTGLTAAMDNRYMKMHYTWIRSMVVPTFEWRFLPVKIESGRSFRTTQTYLAFAGLKKINGAGEQTAGSLEVVGETGPGKPVKIVASVVGAKPMGAAIVLTAQWLPKGSVEEVGRAELTIPRVGPASYTFTFTPTKEGTYALVGKVIVNRRTDCELEEPLQAGKASAAYALLPKEPRLSADLGPKPEDLDVTFSSMETETPHVKWARPYAYGVNRSGKRLKALVLCVARGMREIVELKQRMDLDVDTSLLAEYYPNEACYDYGRLISKELLRKRVLKFFKPEKSPYDVVIVSGAIWKLLGKFMAQRVREWTEAGTGLIVVGPTDKSEAPWDILPVARPGGVRRIGWDKPISHPITNGLPHALLPVTPFWNCDAKGLTIATAGKKPAIVVGTHGKGRTVAVMYKVNGYRGRANTGLTPPYMELSAQEFRVDYWEYYHSMLAKAILWAANVEPQVSIAQFDVAQPLDLAAGRTHYIKCTLAAKQPRVVKITYRTHRGLAQRTDEMLMELLPVADKAVIGLPLYAHNLRAGPNMLDVWIKDEKGRTIDWTSTIITAKAPMEIKSVKLAKKSFGRDEPVTGEVEVRRVGQSEDDWLRVSIKDPRGRVLWRSGRLAPETDSVKLSARLAALVFSPHDVIAEAGRGTGNGERVMSCACKSFFVDRERRWDDFHAMMWGSGYVYGERMYYKPTNARILREHGVTHMLINAQDWNPYFLRAVMNEGLYAVGGGGGWGRPSDPVNDDLARPIRRQSPIDDKTLENVRAWGRRYAARNRMYNVINHVTGDENVWREHWRPDYLAKFRSWLKKEYGAIAALNNEWEADFRDFDSVMPLTTDEARQQKRFAPWVDFRRFDAHAFTTYFATMRKSMHAADPEALLGISGSQDPRAQNAYDWSLLARNLDVVRSYGNLQVALIHSFAPNVAVAPYGHGMRGNPPHLHPRIWRGLFEGNRGFSTCHEGQNFNPDLSLSTGLPHLGRSYVPLRSGIGKAFIHAQRSAPVAVHYSYSSICAAFLMRIENNLSDTRRALFDAVPQAGRGMRFVDPMLVEGGTLMDGRTRVLILPHSVALSDKEAAQIRGFVESGGVLLADLAPGITTEHGRPRPKGLLDDLFGVDRTRAKLTIRQDTLVGTKPAHGIGLNGEAKTAVMETGITATTARAAAKAKSADVPALFVNRVGKGLAVLINGDLFTDYCSLSEGRRFPAYRKRIAVLDSLLDALFTKAGVQPIATIAATDGKPIGRKYVARFNAGKVTYLGLIRQSAHEKQPRRVTMQLPVKGNVRDMVTGKTYPDTDRITFDLNPVHIKAFAVVPYSVRDIGTTLPRAVKVGDIARFAVKIVLNEIPGDHVIRMEVFGPDGKERWYLARNILAKTGQSKSVLPFALNDPTGTWTVRFRDIVSGTVVKREIEVVR